MRKHSEASYSTAWVIRTAPELTFHNCYLLLISRTIRRLLMFYKYDALFYKRHNTSRCSRLGSNPICNYIGVRRLSDAFFYFCKLWKYKDFDFTEWMIYKWSQELFVYFVPWNTSMKIKVASVWSWNVFDNSSSFHIRYYLLKDYGQI